MIRQIVLPVAVLVAVALGKWRYPVSCLGRETRLLERDF